jgi:hypothetical protein
MADLVKLLEQDIDDVGKWANKIPLKKVPETVRALLDVAGRVVYRSSVRSNAAYALRCLKPSGRWPKPDERWPEETVDYALDTLSGIMFNELDARVKESCEESVKMVLYHRYVWRC